MIKTLSLWNLHRLLYCQGGWYLVLEHNWSHRPDHPNAESQEPSLSSVLSGWLVLGFATQLPHRQLDQDTESLELFALIRVSLCLPHRRRHW